MHLWFVFLVASRSAEAGYSAPAESESDATPTAAATALVNLFITPSVNLDPRNLLQAPEHEPKLAGGGRRNKLVAEPEVYVL